MKKSQLKQIIRDEIKSIMSKKEAAMGSSSIPVYKTPKAYGKSTQIAIDIDKEDDDVEESLKAPFRRRKYRGLGRPITASQNEAMDMAAWSNPEAKQQVDDDLKKMSKLLGKASHDVIKIMMNGVRGGKYDPLDLSRGIKIGNVKVTHEGERDFIRMLWLKVRDGFRRYSKRGKLR